MSSCKLCGARFDVEGATGSLDVHIKAFHPGSAEAASVSAPAGGLGSKTKAELVELAEAKDIDASGTKAEIIERLEAAEETEPVATPATTEPS